jgi:hypothetical protein
MNLFQPTDPTIPPETPQIAVVNFFLYGKKSQKKKLFPYYSQVF